ncbi:MAG: hypothetical protein SFY96_12775 [Planctomycetota bacterium]|nr:hypothetical protein [Planctomycetota bacterium]
MTKISKIVFVAGAALSVAPAFAQNPDQSRAYSAELAADAQTRSSLLAPAASGSNGFTISDQSGNYKLTIGGTVQFRYTLDSRSDGVQGTGPGATNVNKDDSLTMGFNNPITRLSFSGNIHNPDLTFKVSALVSGASQNTFDNSGNQSGTTNSGFVLEDAYGQYKYDNGMYVKWGQFKLPTVREEIVGDEYSLAAGTSVINGLFTPGRTQGIEVGYTAESFRMMADFGDGVTSANTDYNSRFEADYALSLRGEFKFAGDWSRFNDFTSFRSQDFAAMVGGGIHWEQGGNSGNGDNASNATLGNESTLYTLDGSLEGAGWNAFAAFTGTTTDGDARNSISTYSLLIQGGVFVSEQAEIFARYEGIFADSESTGVGAGNELDPSDFHFLTVGANYYIIPDSHAAKVTADAVISLNENAGLVNNAVQTASTQNIGPFIRGGGGTNNGVLGDGDSGEVALRLQFQLLF